MPTFAFSGRTRSGETITGERIADTMDAAVSALRREQIMVTRIDPAKAPARAAEAKEVKPGGPKPGKSVPSKSLAIFTRQFSVMIDAGLPLVQCLELLAKEEPDKRLAHAIDQVRQDVEGGSSLNEALHLARGGDERIVAEGRARADDQPRRRSRGGGGDESPRDAAAGDGAVAIRNAEC